MLPAPTMPRRTRAHSLTRQRILEKILKILKDNNISLNSIHKKEQLFIISEIVNSVCHQFIYNNATIDKKLMITESIKDIIKIIK